MSDQNEYFLKKEIQMANRHMRNYSASLASEKCKLKQIPSDPSKNDCPQEI